MGYAFADAEYAKKTVVVTDNLVEYPLVDASITEDKLSSKYNAIVKISGRSLTFKCKNEKELKDLIKKLG